MLRLLFFPLTLIFLFYTIFLSCYLEKQKLQEEGKKIVCTCFKDIVFGYM